VEFTRHLVSACDNYSVMTSATTCDLIDDPPDLGAHLVQRGIQFRNFAQLIEAYECNPVEVYPEWYTKIMSAHRKELQIERQDTRWPIPPGVEVAVASNVGVGKVIDFSHSGLRIEMDRYLGRRVSIRVDLDSPDGKLQLRLKERGIPPLMCEVRWGRTVKKQSKMGLFTLNLDSHQKDILVQELRDFVSAQVKKAS